MKANRFIGEIIAACGVALFVLSGFFTYNTYNDAGQHIEYDGWSRAGVSKYLQLTLVFIVAIVLELLATLYGSRRTRLGLGLTTIGIAGLILFASSRTTEDYKPGLGQALVALAMLVILVGGISMIALALRMPKRDEAR